MKTVSETTRKRIEMQGFTGLDDAQLARLAPWLRVGPAVCLLWTAAGTALGSPAVLWALVPFAALGTVLPVHPFDVPYNLGLRFLFGAPPIPSYGTPRRFACAIATVWIAAIALAFQLGVTTLGVLLGTTFLVGPAVNVTTGFCIPSWLFGLPPVCRTSLRPRP